jgi:hypothetical protein
MFKKSGCGGSSFEEKFGCGDQNSNLADPKEEHPLDDPGLDIRAVLLGHKG